MSGEAWETVSLAQPDPEMIFDLQICDLSCKPI